MGEDNHSDMKNISKRISPSFGDGEKNTFIIYNKNRSFLWTYNNQFLIFMLLAIFNIFLSDKIVNAQIPEIQIKKYEFLDENIFTKNPDCELKSHTTAIQNYNSELKLFDFLLTISFKTSENCKVSCKIKKLDYSNSIQEGNESSNKLGFNKRDYFTFVFNSLEFYQNYIYSCIEKEKNLEIFHQNLTFPKSKESKTKIGIFGDWSKGELGQITLDYLQKNINTIENEFDSLVILGDLAYNLSSDNGKVGNDFLEFIMPITSQIPFMVTPGNHEYKKKFEDFKKRFYLPNNKNTDNLYYSFNLNNAHFISLNSEMLFDEDSLFDKNYKLNFTEWLNNDIQNSHNTGNKWNIVFLHRPLYCSKLTNEKCDKDAKIMRELLEEIFFDEKNSIKKIDLILSGHLHTYERLLPIYNEKFDAQSLIRNNISNNDEYSNPKYPVYLICGSAGNTNGQSKKYDPAQFSRFVSDEVGICQLEINESEIKSKFIRTSDGKIIDEFSIIKHDNNLRILQNDEKNHENKDSTNTNSANPNETKLKSEKNQTEKSSQSIQSGTEKNSSNLETQPAIETKISKDVATNIKENQTQKNDLKNDNLVVKDNQSESPSIKEGENKKEEKSKSSSSPSVESTADGKNLNSNKNESNKFDDKTGDINKQDTKNSNEETDKKSILKNQNLAEILNPQQKDQNLLNDSNKPDNKDKSNKNSSNSEIETLAKEYEENTKSNKEQKEKDENKSTNNDTSNKKDETIKENDNEKNNTDNGKKPKEQTDDHVDEWDEEDSIARGAFGITVCFILLFVILFIYNLIKCYKKNQIQEKPIDATHYSKELQNQTLDEDTVLDLTTN